MIKKMSSSTCMTIKTTTTGSAIQTNYSLKSDHSLKA